MIRDMKSTTSKHRSLLHLVLLLTTLVVQVVDNVADGQLIQLPLEECPAETFTCCEEDCCGPDTVWDGSVCVLMLGASGFTGVYSTAYVEGCTQRACCDSECCGVGTVFDLYTTNGGNCVPQENVEVPVPDPYLVGAGATMGHCCTRNDCKGCTLGQVQKSVCDKSVYKTWCSGGIVVFGCPSGNCETL